jgi:hypothetical protein
MPRQTKKDATGQASGKAITISKAEKQTLSKPQQTFNRLVKKIEKLQKQIETDNQILDEKLNFYAGHLHPLEQQDVQLRKEVVKLLFPYFTEKKPLGKRNKNVLRNILTVLLNAIFSLDDSEPDEELKKVFEALEGMSLEESDKQEAERMKKQLSELLKSMGYELDFSGLDPNMSPEELAAKLEEMEQDLNRQQDENEHRKTVRKKTKKQLEKEERDRQAEEMKTKSIGSIYKSLAKVLHPDLEQDAAEKLRKEALMKELTAAYKKNDLHTLLKLELAWIQAEEANIEKLTDAKLSIYNEVLKEQAAELEEEAFLVPQHPRFTPLRRFAMFPEVLKYANLEREKKEMEKGVKKLEKTLAGLQGEEPLEAVKTLIEKNRR